MVLTRDRCWKAPIAIGHLSYTFVYQLTHPPFLHSQERIPTITVLNASKQQSGWNVSQVVSCQVQPGQFSELAQVCRYICNSVGNQVQIYRTGHRASDLWLFYQNICQFSFKLHELLLKYRSTLETFYMFKNYLLLEMSIFRRAQQKPSSLGMAAS